MHFDASYFVQLLFSAKLLPAVWNVLWITASSMAIGLVIGMLGGIILTSPLKYLHPFVRGYVTFYRGVPVLVQIIFWYNGLAGLSGGAINLPATVAGILALGVNEGAYMTEIVRAGIMSVDAGQREASQALNMGYWQMMRRIILPQAIRTSIPPFGNEVINIIKNTTLLFTIAVTEIFGTAVDIYSQNFKYFEVICVISIWYIVIASTYTMLQRLLEKRFSRGRRLLFS
jgi:His/Glu/Gln/Arg/opine family amino acid ABC transporter permease subunit